MRLKSRYFTLQWQEVERGVLEAEAMFIAENNIYRSKGNLLVTMFENGVLTIYYGEVKEWNNRLLQGWLRRKIRDHVTEVAKCVLPERLHYYERQKGLCAKSVKIRILRANVLGQCSHDNRITLSPKILLLKECYLDCVILHEMAHLRHHHHRKSFWDFLTVLQGEDSKAFKCRMDVMMSKSYVYLDYLFRK